MKRVLNYFRRLRIERLLGYAYTDMSLALYLKNYGEQARINALIDRLEAKRDALKA